MTGYIDSTFWNNNPTTEDIIQALYGSGDDGIWTIYTQHWTGYTSGSCLSAGMTVEYIWTIPTTLSGHTIYVIESGSYDLSSHIIMDDCNALISSGTVVLSWGIRASNKSNIIIDNIWVINPTYWQDWISFHTIINFSIYGSNIYNNGNFGIWLNGSSYWDIKSTITHNNNQHGLNLNSSTNIYIDDLNTYDNFHGIHFEYSSWIKLNWVTSSGNTTYGIYFYESHNNKIYNSFVWENLNWGIISIGSSGNIFEDITANHNSYWIKIEGWNTNSLINIIANENTNQWLYLLSSSWWSSGNILSGILLSWNNKWLEILSSNSNNITNVETYNNTTQNISLSNSSNNTLTDVVTNNAENGIYIFNSSGNILSWLQAYGNYYGGLHLYNSNSNTGINITANSNEGWLYMENSSWNNFENISINNSTKNGVVLISGSNYNTLSGVISSGNMWYGAYIANSSSNIINNSTIDHNKVWIVIETWNTNSISYSLIKKSNYNGIFITYWSWNIIDSSTISWNNSMGIWTLSSSNDIIKDSTIYNNGNHGIAIIWGDANIISWTTLSWNTAGITINETTNSSIINTNDHSDEWYSIRSEWWSGNIFTLFSWNRGIYVSIHSWAIGINLDYPLEYIFDTYTKSNNHIEYHASRYVTLTGNLTIWSSYYPDFDELSINNRANWHNYIIFSWVDYFVSDWDTWNGAFYSPVSITTWVKKAYLWETWTSLISQFYDAIEVISGDTYLTINWGTGTINFQVLSWTSWQHLSILKSNDWSTWSINSPDNICILDSSLNCNFNINWDIKLFAFWTPGMFFTWTTQSWTVITSGGHYNTGIIINFTWLNISGARLNGVEYFDNTLITGNTTHTFVLEDNEWNTTGITFTIDTSIPSATAIYPNTWLNITGTNNISFLRSGLDVNMSGYTLYIGSTWYTTTNTWYTINNMTNGTYTRYVIATDLAGNTWVSNSSTFRISTPLTGTAILSWGNMIKVGSVWYTNWYATFDVRANQPCRYIITGIYLDTFSGDYLSDMTLSRSLTGSDGDKTVYITFSTWAEIPLQITNTIKLDTVTYPATLISPLTGTTVSSWAINLAWNGSSTVESVGYSGYTYYLSDTGTFATVLTSWFTTATGVSIVGTTITGVLYWKVDTLDRLGNTSGSSVGSFIYSNTADITPNSFSFSDVNDARRDRIYVSNTVYITGMTPGVNVLASINNGALYISGDMVGTTGFVQNGRPVKIELVSSDDYDETVSSTLTINGISDTFSITTMEEDEDTDTDTDYEDIETNLSNTEKLMIIAIFETLRDVYAGDKEEEFFNTFLVMLENKMDDFDNNDDEYDALKYLSDLVEQYYEWGDFGDNIDNKPWIINGIYTAPNSKKYTITYDSSKQRFTSTNFVVPKYFPTLDTLKYIIDINNPVGSQYANAKPILARWKTSAIDGTRQTSPYTAPNKKVFYFFKTIDGRYTSYTFTSERWFNSLNDVKEFIFNTNK